MPEFSVNTERFDPYKNFKFRVKWDGKYVPGIFRVHGFMRRTLTKKLPGPERHPFRYAPARTTFDPIILIRGRTHDTEFENWANQIWNIDIDPDEEPTEYKKNITVELFNEAGQLAIAYNVFNCWPIRYNPLGKLDANDTEIATETLVLIHEGWERDKNVAEPSEPSFTEPP